MKPSLTDFYKIDPTSLSVDSASALLGVVTEYGSPLMSFDTEDDATSYYTKANEVLAALPEFTWKLLGKQITDKRTAEYDEGWGDHEDEKFYSSKVEKYKEIQKLRDSE